MKARALVDAVVPVTALVLLGFFLSDRTSGPRGASPAAATEPVLGWQDEVPHGIRIGPADAEIVVTEFVDFECPYCARFAAVADSFLTEVPRAALVVHHFPLTQHRFAIPTAIAAECAERQGRFAQMYRTLFAHQDSFGLRPWRQYALDAGVPDPDGFDACVLLPVDSFPRIAYGRAMGQRKGVQATPTVWVDGEHFRTLPPNLGQLRKALREKRSK